MADDVSPGEVYRRLLDHEQRTDRVHAALDSRLTELAKDMVTQRMWQQSERDRDRETARLEQEHDTDIADVRSEIKEVREKGNATLSRWLTVLGVVAAFLTVAVMAWGTLRGAK